jgi:hypothetical protein
MTKRAEPTHAQDAALMRLARRHPAVRSSAPDASGIIIATIYEPDLKTPAGSVLVYRNGYVSR